MKNNPNEEPIIHTEEEEDEEDLSRFEGEGGHPPPAEDLPVQDDE